MQLIQHLFGVWVMVFVELHCAPAILAPVSPVLYQGIDGNLPLVEFGSSIQNFLLTVITLSTLPISIRPLRKQWRFAGEPPVIGYDAVQLWAVKEVVIDCPPDLGAERCSALWRTNRQFTASGAALRRDFVFFVRLQIH